MSFVRINSNKYAMDSLHCIPVDLLHLNKQCYVILLLAFLYANTYFEFKNLVIDLTVFGRCIFMWFVCLIEFHLFVEDMLIRFDFVVDTNILQ